MQRNFKNLLTSSVMAMSVAVSSISQAAGPKGGGPNLGSSSIQRSFSVNTNHQVLNQNTNVLHSTQTFKSILLRLPPCEAPPPGQVVPAMLMSMSRWLAK